jgi:hypothetical protein
MKYYITWIVDGRYPHVDGPAMLTAIDGELELTIRQLMDAAFAIEDIEPDSSYEICSIIRADGAQVIY